jgi:flagellar FliL protein
MSATAALAADAPAGAAAPRLNTRARRRILLSLAVIVVLAAAVAGLWFGGILPPLLGIGTGKATEAASRAHDGAATVPEAPVTAPTYFDLPDIVANLNAGARRSSFVKLHARIELARPEDQAAMAAALPRLLDLFQTYLRETRPEELRGSAGTYRLREELIARANIAASPARVVDVLFTEMLIQ